MIERFNNWLAVKITNSVGTMWCAYAFALLSLTSLPAAIKGGTATLVTWIAQTFLQLVLLSVIVVGQKVQSRSSEAQAEATRKVIIDTHTIVLHLIKDLHQKVSK